MSVHLLLARQAGRGNRSSQDDLTCSPSAAAAAPACRHGLRIAGAVETSDRCLAGRGHCPGCRSPLPPSPYQPHPSQVGPATADYLARLIDLGVLPPDMDREGRMLVRRMRNMIARMPKRSQPKP